MKCYLFPLILGLTAPAWADETALLAKLDPAWKAMEGRVTRLLGSTGQRQLLDMAYAQVAADACPPVKLDNQSVEATLTKLAGIAKREPAAQRQFENALMADFGVYTGLVLAESFLDKPGFCAAVERLKVKRTGPGQFWTTK